MSVRSTTAAALTPIALFKILNALPLASVHTPFVDRVDLDRWPWWREAWQAFESDDLPPMKKFWPKGSGGPR